eukprot:Selendium_serpulae@DN6213_c0_g1_i17.p1
MHMPRYPSYEMYHPRRHKDPEDEPIIDWFPCCHFAPAMTLTSVTFNLHDRAPPANCRAIALGLLHDHLDEQKYHGCSYGDPDGGPVDPSLNEGFETQLRHQPLGVTAIGKGSCVNLYFNQESGALLSAPRVTADGQCADQYKGRRHPTMVVEPPSVDQYRAASERRRRMQHADTDYSQEGYDYILDCTCNCKELFHSSMKKEHVRPQIGYA